MHSLFTGKFGPAIDFHRTQWRSFRDWAFIRNAIDRGGTHVDEGFDPGSCRLIGRYTTAFHVHFPEFLPGFRERYKGRVMMDDVHLLHGIAHTLGITNIAFHNLDSSRSARILPLIQDAHPLSTHEQASRNQIAQKTRTTCDQMRHSFMPWLRHQLSDRRIPSSSAIAG